MIQKLKDLEVVEWSRSIPEDEVYTSQLIGEMIKNQQK